MPYKFPFEIEIGRSRSMTVAKGIDHICRATGCNKAEGERRLRKAVAEFPGLAPPVFDWIGVDVLVPQMPKTIFRLSRDMVEKIWPMRGQGRRGARPWSEGKLLRWWVKNWVPQYKGKPPPRPAEDLAAARKFVSPSVPREAVRKLRADPKLTPESWRKRGLRSKK
jgi:hypothetical protein